MSAQQNQEPRPDALEHQETEKLPGSKTFTYSNMNSLHTLLPWIALILVFFTIAYLFILTQKQLYFWLLFA